MTIQELQSKTDAELRSELARLKTELQELRAQMRLGQTKNVRAGRALRVTIARISTLLQMRSSVN